MIRTSLITASAVAAILSSSAVIARDQGIINQAAGYERSMAIYLHPAGYFFEPQDVVIAHQRNTDHPAVLVKRQAVIQNVETAVAKHPAMKSSVTDNLMTRVYE